MLHHRSSCPPMLFANCHRNVFFSPAHIFVSWIRMSIPKKVSRCPRFLHLRVQPLAPGFISEVFDVGIGKFLGCGKTITKRGGRGEWKGEKISGLELPFTLYVSQVSIILLRPCLPCHVFLAVGSNRYTTAKSVMSSRPYAPFWGGSTSFPSLSSIQRPR